MTPNPTPNPTPETTMCPMAEIHYQAFETPFGNAGWKRLKAQPDMIDYLIGEMIMTVEIAGYDHKKALKIARYNLFEYAAANQARRILKYLKKGMVPKTLIFKAKVEHLEE